jgi:uncharacterized glyoxalase superfamily protein PhnB
MDSIGLVSVVVNDYDEAIHFYTQQFGFVLIEDTALTETKRWVRVAPSKHSACQILLAKATTHLQQQSIGNQTGGRVFLFWYTSNFTATFSMLEKNGVTIVRTPTKEIYGTVAVVADLYGNLWDVIEPTNTTV